MSQPDPKTEIEQLLSAALTARSAGDLGAAEQTYRQIVGLDPTHHGALHNLGVIATITRRLPQAVEWFQRAAYARPDVADTHSNLGAVLKDLGDLDRATTHLTNRATAPLFDTARTTRDLEAVYEEMWREFLGTRD